MAKKARVADRLSLKAPETITENRRLDPLPMSRLFACAVSEARLLGHALYPWRRLLRVKETATPYGWGIGYHQNQNVLVKRRPNHRGPLDFYAVAGGLQATRIVGHVRRHTIGGTSPGKHPSVPVPAVDVRSSRHGEPFRYHPPVGGQLHPQFPKKEHAWRHRLRAPLLPLSGVPLRRRAPRRPEAPCRSCGPSPPQHLPYGRALCPGRPVGIPAASTFR